MQKTLYLRLLCVSVFLSVRESVLLCVEKLNIKYSHYKTLLCVVFAIFAIQAK